MTLNDVYEILTTTPVATQPSLRQRRGISSVPLGAKSPSLAKGCPQSGRGSGIQIKNISTDSRTAGEGDLFIAIPGEKFDGHEFVAEVLSRGAAAAVVSRIVEGAPRDRQILVPDTKEAYLKIGGWVRQQSKAKVIALTGSAGKTTTKEELKFILSKFANVYATTGNFNNDIGVPRTLCAMPADADIAIIEIGMSHAGEIARIVPYVAPDIAIVTNVYPMHIEFFPDGLPGIARAKAEIFSGLKPGGIAVVNSDANHSALLIMAVKPPPCGGVDALVSRVGGGQRKSELSPPTGSKLPTPPQGGSLTAEIICFGKQNILSISDYKVRAKIGNHECEFETSAPGEHHVYNALCVLTVVDVLGFDVARAAEFIKDFDVLPGRGKTHQLPLAGGGNYMLIDESYSAQPESLKIAIKNLDAMPTCGRKIAVIGKMAEIGEKSQEMHQEIGRLLAQADIDVVIGVCPETRDILAQLRPDQQQFYFENAQPVAEFLTGTLLRDGDTVLIKGSHYGSRLFETVDKLI